jgi:hypothetical protein
MTFEAMSAIQSIAARSGVYAGQGAVALERLHDIVIPVFVDLEEEPILGFTLGRMPDTPPSLHHPAYVTIHTGTTHDQARLGYAYLAASLLVDPGGCSAPLPPATRAAVDALPQDERNAWLQALALLVPPELDLDASPRNELAALLRVPEPLLELYTVALQRS